MESFWEGLIWGMGYREATERKKRCIYCGRKIPIDSKFCPYCGKKLERT